ncbi:MAG: hypothetical protein KatS3mg093_022 [Candidatus Parcubacteria bacterium]|nr:MAG: hypothetical protein KatS3mg093_022 [Candidatus Parcubacteria bacterium]
MQYPYQLKPLPYSYDALEPYIDKMTMEIHHTKHHQTYINNLNLALEKYPEWQNVELEEILKNLDQLPEDIRTAVRNNGGGHYNHSLFWEIMKPSTQTSTNHTRTIDEYMSEHSMLSSKESELIKAIEESFGSFENFKNIFSETALKHFGSGWAWLVINSDKKLEIYSLPNQDSPLMKGDWPIVGLDIWEHAYYLKYQNRRGEYIENWWQVVNWEAINKIFLNKIK